MTDLSRERLERTFNTNIVAMFTLTQVDLTVIKSASQPAVAQPAVAQLCFTLLAYVDPTVFARCDC